MFFSMRLIVLRGVIIVNENDVEVILVVIDELMREILVCNELGGEDFVSCIFTFIFDFDVEFFVVVVCKMGFLNVLLLCACEILVFGALLKVICVLIYVYKFNGRFVEYVYFYEVCKLWLDL